MRLRNTAESWGAVAKLLHWAGAVLILSMLGLGLIMVHAGIASGPKFEAYQLHKSTGVLVLAVTLVRGLWRMTNPPPAPPDGVRPWEQRLACALHFGLYVLPLAMIASGWLMVSASPLPIPIHLPFGLAVPNLTGPDALIEARAKFTHEVLSKLIIGAVALHVMGALKHHFIGHDGVLLRMLPFGAGVARRRSDFKSGL
jgi:cytochrome b561